MRKEIELSDRTLIKLQRLADKEGRKLKPYMERVLIMHAEMESEKQISLLDNIKLVQKKKKK